MLYSLASATFLRGEENAKMQNANTEYKKMHFAMCGEECEMQILKSRFNNLESISSICRFVGKTITMSKTI